MLSKLLSKLFSVLLFVFAVLSACAPKSAFAQSPNDLPRHIVILGANFNPDNHPQGSALFGVGTHVADKDYLTNVTEFTPASVSRGVMTANRSGVQHIVYQRNDLYAFLTADGGIAVVAQSVSGSWSGGAGVAQKITAIRAHNVWAFGHVRIVDSPAAVDRRSVVASVGFVFGGN